MNVSERNKDKPAYQRGRAEGEIFASAAVAALRTDFT